jgi:hypothetical protein
MKSSGATGNVCIVIEHNLETGEVVGIRIVANRPDQEAAAVALAREIILPPGRRGWRRLFQRDRNRV